MKKFTPNNLHKKTLFQLRFLLILFVGVLPLQLFSQKKVQPVPVDKTTVPSLSKVFKKYDLFKINTAEIRSFANSNGKGFSEYEFEFEGYPTFPISIYENDLMGEEYKAFSGDETGKQLLPKTTAKTYSGSITGNANSAVYLTLADNLIDGLVKQNDKTYLIEPLRYFEKSADASIYVLYEAGDMIPHSGMTCGLTEANEHRVQEVNKADNNTSSVTGQCKTIEVAIASDYDMVTRYGLSEVAQHNIAVINLLHVFYDNAQIGAQYLQFKIAGQYISTAAAGNASAPAYSGQDAQIILSNFAAWGQAGNFGFSYDDAQLWTTRDIGVETPAGSGVYSYTTVGLGYVGATCSSLRYMLLEDFSGDLLLLTGMVAHETGHNLGASHDVSPGFIMAPSLSNPPATTFSPESLTAMNNYISGTGGSCFSNCTTNPPIAAFISSVKTACTGSSVSFTDYSAGTISSRTWLFTGGNISTSNAVNPTVTYNTAGTKSVKLLLSGPAGSSEATQSFNVMDQAAPASITSIAGNSTTPALSSFKLAGINYPGPQVISPGGSYADLSCLQNTMLTPGTTYTVNFDAGIFLGSQYSTKVQVFIDYNGDNDFLDAGENVYSGTPCYYGNIGNNGQFSFTTPASPATNRFLRLRVVGVPCDLAFTNGHAIYSNSPVQDYAVYFPGPSCQSNLTVLGPGSLCNATSGTYTLGQINASNPASNFNWTVPAGTSITSGQGTSSVTVNFPAGYSTGQVGVSFTGCDGTVLTRSLNVIKTSSPLIAGEISGIADICAYPGPLTTTYSIPPVTNANSYNWLVPAGCTIISGQGTNYIQVTFTNSFNTSNIQVIASACGATSVFKSITVTGALKINAIASPGGSISLPGITGFCPGGNITYAISADPCNYLTDVQVDGVSQGAITNYTFSNVTSNHSIVANFAPITYFITTSATAGGSVSPSSQFVDCGTNNTYTITPATCYNITSVLLDGVSLGPVTTVSLNNIAADHTISASFTAGPSTYFIFTNPGPGGNILSQGSVNCGGSKTVTIVPGPCRFISSVVVDGVSQGVISSYTFTNVSANHTISATFSLSTYSITVTAPAHGSITPGTGSVNCGSNATYTITPNACYSIADVVVDGVSQGVVGTYTFTNVTANHTISVTFANTFSITVTAPAHGSITPGTGSVNCGSNATYTITPDACYSIADVVVDGVSQGAVGSYTFMNVTANHTISATFAGSSLVVSEISGAVNLCTVSGPTDYSVNPVPGATYAWTLPPAVSILSGQGTNTIQVQYLVSSFATGTISVTVSKCGAADVTKTISVSRAVWLGASAGAGGTISSIGTSFVCPGTDKTYTITPDACHNIANVTVNSVSQGAISSYTFTNVNYNNVNVNINDRFINASFSLKTYPVTVSAGTGGSISPGSSTENCGSSRSYTITPNACYSIVDVVVDGVSQGATGSYTLNNITAPHAISATFALNTYTITVNAGTGGSITGTASVNCGSNATYTITADACHTLTDVIVDGVSQGAVGSYTFTNVTATHTISTTFLLNTYAITVTAGANGSITPGTGSVNCGSDATYTITPNACYSIADVIVDGVSQSAVGTYSFTNVTANHTISATFVATTYTITITPGVNGSITPVTGSVACGTDATYTFTPNAGFAIADVLVDGSSQGAVGTYTFTNVTATHIISASFVIKATYTIISSAAANGSISPNAATVVNNGANQSYTITPASCFHIADVLVDAVSAGAVNTYTFSNVTANHTISATFAANTPIPAPTVTGPTNVCPYIGTGDPVTYTFSSAGATGYTYILPPNVGTVNSTANSVTVTFPNGFTSQANKQIKVTATSACGNSPQTIYYLLTQAPNTPGPITGNTNVCPVIGTANTYMYSVPPVLSATSYVWTGQLGTTTITYPNGNGINGNTVEVSFSADFTSSSISVVAVNGCGTSGGRGLALVKTNPQQPGLISGSTNVCENLFPGGSPGTYTIVAVPGATSYNWNVSGGAAILTHPNGAGPNNTQVTVSFPSNYTSGTITISATNGCGTSSVRSLSLTRLNPATPGIPDVIQLQDCPGRQYSYTIASVPANATLLIWNVPAGATIVSSLPAGPLPTSIIVSYPVNAINGAVTVQSSNNCGVSNIRSTTVKLPACPEARPMAKGGTVTTSETMQVNVFPNPSVTDFKLQVLTAGKELIHVRILDMQGREYKNLTVNAYQTTTIGSDLKAGAYMMEVRQGDKLKTTKLLKF